MSYALVNRPTADAMPQLGQGASLACPFAVRLRIHVDNAGVLFQTGRGPAGAQFDEPEATLLPGVYFLEQPCDGVRFRSLAAGQPAQVSVQALTEGDVTGE